LQRFNASNTLMSSSDWPWQLPMGGIFSTSALKSPWSSYNKVLIGYCSSDVR
jgi:hypothetical protein